MASQNLRSIAGHIRATRIPADEVTDWTPAIFNDLFARPLKAFEIFFSPFLSVAGTYLATARSTNQDRKYFSLEWSSNTELTVDFKDAADVDIQIFVETDTTPQAINQNMNSWFHLVVRFDLTVNFFIAHLGRLGLGIAGQTGPQFPKDDIGDYVIGSAPQASTGTNGQAFAGVKKTHSITASVSYGIRQRGNSGATNGSFPGMVCEARWWDTDIGFVGPNGYDAYRTRFVSATPEPGAITDPRLIHCHRLNEGTLIPADYVDVGYRSGEWDGDIVSEVFNPSGVGIHPFNLPSGMLVEFFPPPALSLSSETAIHTVTRGLNPPAALSLTSEQSRTEILINRALNPPANPSVTSDTIQMDVARSMSAVTLATVTAQLTTIQVDPGFKGTAQSVTSETATLTVNPGFAATDGSVTSDTVFMGRAVSRTATDLSVTQQFAQLDRGEQVTFGNPLTPSISLTGEAAIIQVDMFRDMSATDLTVTSEVGGEYREVILALNPQFYWNFDDVVLPNVLDQSGNNNHATITGTPSFVSGITPAHPAGEAVSWTDAAQTLQSNSNLLGRPAPGPGTYSIILTYNPLAATIGSSNLIRKPGPSGLGWIWEIELNIARQVFFKRTRAAGGTPITFTPFVPANDTAHLIIATFSPSVGLGMRLYFDGVLVSTDADIGVNQDTFSDIIMDTPSVDSQVVDDVWFIQDFIDASTADVIFDAWKSGGAIMAVLRSMSATDLSVSGQLTPTLTSPNQVPMNAPPNISLTSDSTVLSVGRGMSATAGSVTSDSAQIDVARAMTATNLSVTGEVTPTLVVGGEVGMSATDGSVTSDSAAQIDVARAMSATAGSVTSESASIDVARPVTATDTSITSQINTTLLKGGEVPLQDAGDLSLTSEPAVQLDATRPLSATATSLTSETAQIDVARRLADTADTSLTNEVAEIRLRRDIMFVANNQPASITSQNVPSLQVDQKMSATALSVTSETATIKVDPGFAATAPSVTSENTVLLRIAHECSATDGSASSEAAAILLRVDRGVTDTDTSITSESASLTAGTLEVAIQEKEQITAPLCKLEAYLALLDIWNVALTKLGVETLTATTDSVSQATAISDNWDLFKRNFLRDHVWNGAKTTVLLTTFKDSDSVTAVVPAARWAHAYELPTVVGREWVRSVRLNGRENRSGEKSRDGLGLWEEEVIWNDVGTGKMCLLTDEVTANLEYIFRVQDNDIDTFLPEDMQWAMALTLAVHMAADLGSSNVDIRDLEAQAEIARRNARRTDAQSGAKVQYLDTTIADSFF